MHWRQWDLPELPLLARFPYRTPGVPLMPENGMQLPMHASVAMGRFEDERTMRDPVIESLPC